MVDAARGVPVGGYASRALNGRLLRLLVLVPFAPRFDAPHGGGRVVASLLARLAERHRVALIYLRRADEHPLDEALATQLEIVEEVELAPEERPLWTVRAARLRKLLGAHPDRVVGTGLPAYGDRVRSVVAEFQPDLVQLEMDEMGQYLDALDGCRAPRLLVAHEPGASAARDYRRSGTGLRRWSRALDEIAWARFSRRVLGRVDAVVAFTQRDAEAVRALRADVRVREIPLTVDVPERPLDPKGGDPPTVLFFGSYEHAGNADAAQRLTGSIYPSLRSRHPEVVLQLVGAKPGESITASAGEGIVVTGEVTSVVPYLDAAAVVVAPLRLGGGMRVKVLETLAAGKALVASSRALEGLEVEPGREVVVAETDDDFAAAISELVSDQERRVALARSARRWAEANLGWESVVDAYEALYHELLPADK